MATMKKAKGGYVLEHNGASIIYKDKADAEKALLRVTLGAMGAETPSDEKRPREKLTEGEEANKVGEDERAMFNDIMMGKSRGYVLMVDLDANNALARMSKVSKDLVMATLPTLLKIETPEEGARACVSFVKGVQHAEAHAKGECGEEHEGE